MFDIIKIQLPKIATSLLINTTQIIAFTASANASLFSVSPMVTVSDAKGGQSKNAINVSNSAKEPLRVRVYAEDFTYERSKGYVSITKHDLSAVGYLQFSPRELVIPPGVTRNIRVGFTLPSSLPDGEYRASIFVEELKEKQVESNSTGTPVVLKARVASIFFISKGGMKADISLNGAAWNNQQKNLNILLTNKGKKSAYPNINWNISQNGKEVSNGNILGVVLQAGTDREIILRTKGKNLSLPPGSYQLTGEIINTGQKPVPFSIGVSIP